MYTGLFQKDHRKMELKCKCIWGVVLWHSKSSGCRVTYLPCQSLSPGYQPLLLCSATLYYSVELATLPSKEQLLNVGFLPHTWETWKELWLQVLAWLSFSYCRHLGWKISFLSLSLFHSYFLINKNKSLKSSLFCCKNFEIHTVFFIICILSAMSEDHESLRKTCMEPGTIAL